jgi:hypothetical protein
MHLLDSRDDGCRHFRLTVVWILLIFGIAFVTIVMCSKAFAHDFEHPERTPWMMMLQDAAGNNCCEPTDNNAVKDVPWDTWRDELGYTHFRVYIEGDWVKVDDSKVVKAPNNYRVPIVWVTHDNGVPMIKCFLPGAGL